MYYYEKLINDALETASLREVAVAVGVPGPLFTTGPCSTSTRESALWRKSQLGLAIRSGACCWTAKQSCIFCQAQNNTICVKSSAFFN